MSVQPYRIMVGTYADKHEAGIYMITFDPQTLELQQIASYDGIDNPSYLTMNKSRTHLYAVSEMNEGSVVAYALDEKLQLNRLNEMLTLGGSPCFVMLDQSETMLFAANYSGANTNGFIIAADGSLSELRSNMEHTGSSVNSDNQNAPHPHAAVVDPSNRYVMVPDLGTDHIEVYAIDPVNQTLVPHQSVAVTAGLGPRHLVFHPSQPYAYLVTEMGNTVEVFAYQAEQGLLEHVQSVSTLPESFTGVSYGADIHITPDGQFLYCTNRGHDSLAMFRIDDENGRLQLMGCESTRGQFPRNFCITPDGQYVFAANQNSDNIEAYRIEAEGELSHVASLTSIRKPVCLQVI